MKTLIAFLLIILPISVFAQHQHWGMPPTATIDPGLGKVHHAVSTKHALAQRYFDQGLAYIYAFNHDEAVKSFRQAAELDPKLAMAYWGVSLARGSNYNLQADPGQLSEAYQNLQKAQSLASATSVRDRAYIEALSKRYSSDAAADQAKLGKDYKTAMAGLVKQFPADLDAATLYAESMMNLRPWQLWTLDGKPAEDTLEIVAVLEGVLRRDPTHSGANHYYIHAIEASPTPERALASAKRLSYLAPSAGHLVHMPSHIFIRTGSYDAAARANARAIVADQNYIKKNGPQGIYPMMYFNHNISFLSSVSAMSGRYAEAMKNARELRANVAPMLSEMPMLEAFAAYPVVTMVRFHKWDEIMKEDAPPAGQKLTTTYWHLARGIAAAETGKAADADKELEAYTATARDVPADMQLGNNKAGAILKVGELLLTGETSLAKGDIAGGIKLLSDAAAASDMLIYDEPPDWDLPIREWLGRAYLSNRQYAEAEKVYRMELTKHPRNGRALFGLAEALNKQGKVSSAKATLREYATAWATADTKLRIEELYRK